MKPPVDPLPVCYLSLLFPGCCSPALPPLLLLVLYCIHIHFPPILLQLGGRVSHDRYKKKTEEAPHTTHACLTWNPREVQGLWLTKPGSQRKKSGQKRKGGEREEKCPPWKGEWRRVGFLLSIYVCILCVLSFGCCSGLVSLSPSLFLF